MVKLIQLTQGKFAQVDDEMYEELNQYKWYAEKNRKTYYAVRTTINPKTGKRGAQRMHKVIMQLKGLHVDGLVTDHKDGDGLNNQGHNLRMVTVKVNNENRHVRIGG